MGIKHRGIVWAALLLAAAPSLAQQGEDFAQVEARARAGDVRGMVALGEAFEKGSGVTQNYADAARWYRSAADKGSSEGMRHLADIYAEGKGVSKDFAEALEWNRAAVAKGNARAMWNMGMAYLLGRGVAQSDADAVRWYRQAAAKGDEHGINSLGVMYHSGRGVTKDEAEALRLFRRVADKGANAALFNMATMYREGAGVPKDTAIADRLSEAWRLNADPKKWREIVAGTYVPSAASQVKAAASGQDKQSVPFPCPNDAAAAQSAVAALEEVSREKLDWGATRVTLRPAGMTVLGRAPTGIVVWYAYNGNFKELDFQLPGAQADYPSVWQEATGLSCRAGGPCAAGHDDPSKLSIGALDNLSVQGGEESVLLTCVYKS